MIDAFSSPTLIIIRRSESSGNSKRLYSETKGSSSDAEDGTVNNSCPICDCTFSSESVMRRHMRQQHDVEPLVSIPQTLKCPLCDALCRIFEDADTHLQSSRGVHQELEEIYFDTVEDSKIWKAGEEACGVVHFVA